MSDLVEVTEEEWIQIIRAKKDPREFEPIYRKYFNAIFRFIHNRTQDEQLSADLTSSVFLKAIRSLPGYSYRGIPFSSWLYRIAYNECMEHFRKKKRQHFVIIDQAVQNMLTEELQPEEAPCTFDALVGAISRLDEKEISLIELRFYEGHSFSVIAEILGITENYAKVRMHRVLKKLRKYLLR